MSDIAEVTRKIKVTQEKIKEAELEKARLESRREEALKQLKENFELNSVEAATVRVKELGEESEKLAVEVREIEGMINEVSSKMGGV